MQKHHTATASASVVASAAGQRTTPVANAAGFTLVELLIAVAVVAILLAVALPSFLDSIRKGRRADAVAAIAAVQQAQERWRSNNAAYATDAQMTLAALPSTPPGLGQPQLSSSGRYRMSIASSSTTGYVVVATAVAGTSQAQDAGCQVMAVRVAGGAVTNGSAATSPPDWADPGRCWAR